MLKIKIPVTLDVFHNINERLSEVLPEEFEKSTGKIQLAIEELLVNIFYYSYGKENIIGEAEITFDTKEYDNIICAYISIRDFGPAFNPFGDIPHPNLNQDAMERPIGGLGIHLVKTLTTHYNYQYDNNSNLVELYFKP